METLTKIKKEWEEFNNKNFGKDSDEGIGFIDYIKIKIDKTPKIEKKIELLESLITDLWDNRNQIQIECWHYEMPLNKNKYTVKQLKAINDYNQREITVYEYIFDLKEMKDYWKEVLISNSETNISKITWLKNKQDLVSLFDDLQKFGFIAFKKNKDELLRNHFTWHSGEINKGSLKHMRNNLNNKYTYKDSDEIALIKNKLKTPKTF